jgi:hypothetical protein
MVDDPLAWAQKLVKRAGATAVPPPEVTGAEFAVALSQIKAALDKLAEAERNLKIQQALLDDRLLRVEHNRAFTTFNRMVSAGGRIWRRDWDSEPARLKQNLRDSKTYVQWVAHESASLPSMDEARSVSRGWSGRPKISILLVARDCERARKVLESLAEQAYENWEVCAAVREPCESQIADSNGRLRFVAVNGLDDAQALNAAANLATGEYLFTLAETAKLSAFALHHVAEALQREPFDLLYSDEDRLDGQQRRVRPVFKPDWSPDLLTSCMYLGELVAIRRELFLQAGGFSSAYGDAYLFDLVLRLADEPLRVWHIPRVLYHRLSASPFSATPDASAARAIADAVNRRERTASAGVPTTEEGTFPVRREPPSREVCVIVCSKSAHQLEPCLASLRATAGGVVRQIVVVAHEETDPNPLLHSVIEAAGATALTYRGAFDFAEMNNRGAGIAEAPNLLFLNDDVVATKPGWAELLVEQLAREEVGVAGAILRYPSGELQHAGIVAGIADGVGHSGRHMHFSELWPWLLETRNVSAVTGACLAIRKELFFRAGGFDTQFPNNYNDVDLCFRVRSQGYRVTCVAVPGLIHAECQTRPGIVRYEERFRFYARWGDLLSLPDPYYSVAFAPTEKIALNLDGDNWYRTLFEKHI